MTRTPWIKCTEFFTGQYALQGNRLFINGWDVCCFQNLNGKLSIGRIDLPLLRRSGFNSMTLYNHKDQEVADLELAEIPVGYGVMLDSSGPHLYIAIVKLGEQK